MKKSLFIVLACAFVMSFTSCQKCIECTYDVAGQNFTSGEICGSSSEIDEVQATWETAATTVGATVTCVEK